MLFLIVRSRLASSHYRTGTQFNANAQYRSNNICFGTSHNQMKPRNPAQSALLRPLVRLTDVTLRSLPALSLVIGLTMTISARADGLYSCTALRLSPTSGLCTSTNMLNQISGIEGIEMNFYGSQVASDTDISFKNVNYYQIFTPKPATNHQTSSNEGTNNFGGGSWTGSTNTSAFPDPSSSNPGSSVFSSDISVLNTPVDSEILKSDLANGKQPLTTLDPVPEPRYSVIAMLIAGLAISTLRKLQQGRRRVL